MNRALILLAAATLPLMAHHSVRAQYDVDRAVTIQGVVADAEWINPHAYFYVEVTGEYGSLIHWKLETSSPNSLMKRGWSKSSVKAGSSVTVTGYPAKDGRKQMSAAKFVTADGKELDSSDSWMWMQIVDGKQPQIQFSKDGKQVQIINGKGNSK